MTAFNIAHCLTLTHIFLIRLSFLSAFIHSHINYGIASWENTYQRHLSSLHHLQNRAFCIIFSGSLDSSTTDLLRRNILIVNNLFQFNLIMLLCKQITNLLVASLILSLTLQGLRLTTTFCFLRFILIKVKHLQTYELPHYGIICPGH